MEFYKEIELRNGLHCILRNCEKSDGEEMVKIFNKTHAETDYLLTYPDEKNSSAVEEGEWLEKIKGSGNEIEIAAVVDGKIVGSAGIEAVGEKYKVRHRAEFGISILKEYWGLGIGDALLKACIECAKKAKYTQLELDVVAENSKAVRLYKKNGFVEFGKNAKGFYSKTGNYQELVYMLLNLE